MAEKPPDRRAEDAGRVDRAAPTHFDADEPEEKVAPWKKWTAVALSTSSGGDKYPVQFTVSGLDHEKNARYRYTELISSAAHKYFKIKEVPRENEGPAAYLVETHAANPKEPTPAVKLLRVVYNELIVRFKPHVESARANEILEKTEFQTVGRSGFAKNQWIVRHVRAGVAGKALLEEADRFGECNDVEFAWPNSVAEYRRCSGPLPWAQRWWLDRLKVNLPAGVRSPTVNEGDPSIIIAVLDDGVDIDHPNLVSRVMPGLGRDFNFSPSEPNYSNPRPKINLPGADGDYHGTQCAGVICSDGSEMGFKGVAPGCRLVAVRIFDGDHLISETGMVANAITYATSVADVISCSWGGPRHKAVATAIDGTSQGRGGKGSVFVGSAGNDGKLNSIAFPARHPLAIAVGACGPDEEVTDDANRGDRLDVVAPSSLNDTKVYSTDVSQPGWGFNTSAAGFFSDEFGSTSAAAAMAAGVAALCLSANSNLTAAEVRAVLREKADKIGTNPQVVDSQGDKVKYNAGRSKHFGSGRINAAAAVEKAKQMLGPS